MRKRSEVRAEPQLTAPKGPCPLEPCLVGVLASESAEKLARSMKEGVVVTRQEMAWLHDVLAYVEHLVDDNTMLRGGIVNQVDGATFAKQKAALPDDRARMRLILQLVLDNYNAWARPELFVVLLEHVAKTQNRSTTDGEQIRGDIWEAARDLSNALTVLHRCVARVHELIEPF